jgi:hypothetical protein
MRTRNPFPELLSASPENMSADQFEPECSHAVTCKPTAELHVLYVQLVREKSLMADFRQIARNSRDTSKAWFA